MLAGLVAASAAHAAIYSCVDGSGRRLTSDRPIVECATREQRMLNTDGSVRQIVPPTMTPDERAEADAKERQAAADRVAQQDAMRRDRNLVNRFPNDAAHMKAREAALDDVRKSLKASQTRLELLTKERKPLLDDAEFYLNKPLPARLKQQLDANEAAADAQRSLVQGNELEIVRINTLYDAELERLKKLWAGAQPGSMGVLPPAQPASGAASTPPATRRESSARR